MLNRSYARRFGVLCTLAVVAGGCAARTPTSFPGAVTVQPPPVFTQPVAEAAPAPGPVFDTPVQGAPPFVAQGVDEPVFEPASEAVLRADAAVPGSEPGPIAYDIDVAMNARVLAFVRLFSGRLKPFLEEGLSRSVQFLPMVQEVFRAEGLPLDLAYVPLVESAFKPTALSRAKARGIWQFMRGTGLENGLTHDWYIDERADPEKATRAAAKYLKTLHDMFDGDWHLALAAYNGGQGRVQRAMRRSGRDDFWELSASSRYLPRETRDYVPLVLAAIIVARNPGEYGLTVQPIEPPRVETVALSNAVDLRRVASWIGEPVETIRTLNPELRQWTTPLRVAEYELTVPSGTGDILRAHLDQTDPASLTTVIWHTVQKGDTLASVAKKLKVTRGELAEANYLSTRARLQVGQRLMIPRAPALPSQVETRQAALVVDAPRAMPASAVEGSAPQSGTGDAPEAVAVVTSARSPGRAAQPAPARQVHRVRRGDTLLSIARLYRTTVSAIKTWNRLRGDTIKVGQRLAILSQRTATATN